MLRIENNSCRHEGIFPFSVLQINCLWTFYDASRYCSYQEIYPHCMVSNYSTAHIMTHTAWSVLQFLYFKTNCLINTIAKLGNYNLWYFSVNICDYQIWWYNALPFIWQLNNLSYLLYWSLIKKRKSIYKLDTRITCFWYTRNIPDTANLNQALDCWELHVCVYSSNREMERIWGRGKTRKRNGTDWRNRTGGTGKAETEKRVNAEKRVKRGKEGKTRKRG